MNDNQGVDFIGMIKDRFTMLINWMKPSPADPAALAILKLILKIPVFVLVLALSPVILIILLFVFLAAF